MDFDMNVNMGDFTQMMNRVGQQGVRAAEQGLHDSLDELTRIASEITPIDKGTLTRSNTKTVRRQGENLIGEVEFSVREGSFNYALWIHEGIYNHGEDTQQRSGTVGWSGKRYYVGRKYLERPLKGEEQAFYEHIADKVRHAVGG